MFTNRLIILTSLLLVLGVIGINGYAESNTKNNVKSNAEKTAQYFESIKIKFWNWQQDLGISGLRNLKLSYRPVYILKKYEVSPGSEDV